jgi:hypothetical protein
MKKWTVPWSADEERPKLVRGNMPAGLIRGQEKWMKREEVRIIAGNHSRPARVLTDSALEVIW